MSARPLHVAFVVQRWGADVNGGAEQLARTLAHRLAERPEIGRLAVLTTCAHDHITWANHYAPGASREGRVELERFPVRLRRFGREQKHLFDAISGRFRSRRLESLWLLLQGPWSPALLERVRKGREEFDAFVFVTYLYHPAVRGLPLVRERAVLLATAHDEPAMRLGIFDRLFGAARAVACLTPEEQAFLHTRFAPAPRTTVVGAGLDAPPPEPAMDAARPAAASAPYVLYVGRIESEKGVPAMLEGFRAFRRRFADATFTGDDGVPFRGADLKLLLAGRAAMELPGDPAIVPLGFVSDDAKHALMRGALALVAPSRYESLSLVTLEAWRHARPVLVNAACDVTRGQVARSDGGAAWEGAEGLADALALALGDPAWRAARGAAGRAWAERECGWDAVEARWLALLAEVAR